MPTQQQREILKKLGYEGVSLTANNFYSPHGHLVKYYAENQWCLIQNQKFVLDNVSFVTIIHLLKLQRKNEMSEPVQPVSGIGAIGGGKPSKKAKLYATSFALVPMHGKLSYRNTNGVKIGNNQAILIPSGKIVKLAADKMVKVRA